MDAAIGIFPWALAQKFLLEMAQRSDEKCFSFFQKGTHLLAELGSKAGGNTVIFPLVWGTGKYPFTRTMAVQKARMARLYGRATSGHGARNGRHGASSKWHGVHKLYHWFTLFLASILCIFRPNIAQFCEAAKAWLAKQGSKWQQLPWYTDVQQQLECISRRKPRRPIFPASSRKDAMVEKEYFQSIRFGVDKQRRDSRFSCTTEALHFSMREKPKGIPTGLGNNSRIFSCASNQRNTSSRSQTSYPLVCHSTRREVEVDHRLSGNQSISSTQTLQIGKLVRNLSIPQERNVGSKDRSETRLFSFGHSRGVKALHLHSDGAKGFSVPGSMLWHEHPSRSVAKCHESFPKKVEKSWFHVLDLPGRHFGRGQLTPSSSKTFGNNVARLGTFRHGSKHKEIATSSHPASGTFGLFRGSQGWNFTSPQRKNEKHSKTTGQAFNAQGDVHQKNGSHFRSHKSVFDGNAFSAGFYGSAGAVCKPARKPWMGQKIAHTTMFKGSSARNGTATRTMEGTNFPGKNSSQGITFRFFARSLGGGRCDLRSHGPRILEGQKRPAYKCERIGGSNKHGEILGPSRGACHFKSGQLRHILVPPKGRGEDPQFEPADQAFHQMVLEKRNKFTSFASEKFGGLSRWTQQVGQRQGGLHFGPFTFPNAVAKNEKTHQTQGRHVCLSRQSSTEKVCFTVPPLAGHRSECPKVPPKRFRPMLCQAPLENNFQLATSFAGQPPPHLHGGGTPLGFKSMVAPTSENARQGDPCLSSGPLRRDVQELLGRMYASAKVAPSLHDTIRKGLQAKQVSVEAAKAYMEKLKSLPRYDIAFKLFWAFCHVQGISTTMANLAQVAGLLLHFDRLVPTQGRHAYSAVLLIPGLEQLQFNPLLRQVKRVWNTSSERYCSFYDPGAIISKLAHHCFVLRPP